MATQTPDTNEPMNEQAQRFYVALGRFIRSRRRQLDITQARLGELVHLPQGAVSRMERGKTRVRHGRLCTVAVALDVSPIALYGAGWAATEVP